VSGRRIIGLFLTINVTLIVILSLFRPFHDAHGATISGTSLLTDTQVPENIRQTLNAKCADCHSSQSRLPFYGRIPPVSWLVQHDITEGRQHLDFASWQTYTQEQKLDLLNRIAAEAKTGEMPPKSYTFVHRGAKLTADDQQALYAWAKAERRRIKKAEDVNKADDTNKAEGK